jgi:hypothetical protein
MFIPSVNSERARARGALGAAGPSGPACGWLAHALPLFLSFRPGLERMLPFFCVANLLVCFL